jgi:lipopolysaccharide transport system ATP-binding protein
MGSGRAPSGQGQTRDLPRGHFYALKQINLEIQEGEVVGIIGRNGAGKSTLLKILSRITPPSEGKLHYRGRMASLLEVGTGFHRELTGRENIFLNGSILGMRRTEIARKLDEIVAFAEIDKFLDTPVKYYSSGMYIRLAFSVAAHLQTDILLVDEVLAVGDTMFQMKCLGKIRDVSKGGRTVLMVSHNLGSIESLCKKGVYLKDGEIRFFGDVQEAIQQYLLSAPEAQSIDAGVLYRAPEPSHNTDQFQIREIKAVDENGEPHTHLQTWDYLKLVIRFYCPHSVTSGSVEMQVATPYGSKLMSYSTSPLSGVMKAFDAGLSTVEFILPRLPLASGHYLISLGLAIPMSEWLCWHDAIATLDVKSRDVYNSSVPPDQQRTPIAVEHSWKFLE